MSRMRRPCAVSIHSLILLTLLAVVPGVVFAQGGSVGMPQNAGAKSYGGGWECDQSYREVDGACTAVMVPLNAYLSATSYGTGWECGRGYREHDEACIAIDVP